MPWSAKEAAHKTKEANTPKKRKAWATIANKALKTYKSEAKAIKIANAAVAKMGDDAMVDSVTTEVLMMLDRRFKRTVEKDHFGRTRKITE